MYLFLHFNSNASFSLKNACIYILFFQYQIESLFRILYQCNRQKNKYVSLSKKACTYMYSLVIGTIQCLWFRRQQLRKQFPSIGSINLILSNNINIKMHVFDYTKYFFLSAMKSQLKVRKSESSGKFKIKHVEN